MANVIVFESTCQSFNANQQSESQESAAAHRSRRQQKWNAKCRLMPKKIYLHSYCNIL